MPSQLRIYTINRGKLDDFVQAWSAGVYPLRRRFGYSIDGAWVIRERNEFVWILSYDGPDAWEAKEAAYYRSSERVNMDPNPASLIARPDQWFITPVRPDR
ncbi:MAG: NIPSNAP family protein [Armatimonadetes bacterium]|nr:NIPSNAP family protein [Armatimonadota bacterium]